MFVVGRFDAHVQGHLARYGEAGVEVDLRHGDLCEGLVHRRELRIEVRILPHVDDHHLEVGIVLRQDQRQALLEKGVVFGKHRDDDRDGRRLLQDRRPSVVFVGGDAPVGDRIIPQLYSEKREHEHRERHAGPAVSAENRIDEIHNRQK